MSKNMIDATNDIPGMGGEMPSGSMADTAGNEMPGGDGEMPAGSMTESSANMGDKSSSEADEMPTGDMTETSGSSGNFSNDQAAGEMPIGGMNGDARGKHTQNTSSSNQSQPFELPGTWKIQLVPVTN